MKCNVSEFICEIDPRKFGRCGMSNVVDGAIVHRYSQRVSSFSVGRIEDVLIPNRQPKQVENRRSLVIAFHPCF